MKYMSTADPEKQRTWDLKHEGIGLHFKKSLGIGLTIKDAS
jgi:hypothetical protein